MQLPWSDCVTLTTAGTVYTLSTLIASAGTPFTISNYRKLSVGIQSGPNNGGTLVYIAQGNSNVSSTHFGAYLYTGGLWEPPPGTLETISGLSQIFLTASADGAVCGVQVNVLSYV